MKYLTLQDLLDQVQAYVCGAEEFRAVRRFVFQYFEAEQDFELSPELDAVFSVLLPYLHFEEACCDRDREGRMRRLCEQLTASDRLPVERSVFALEHAKILDLASRFGRGVIVKCVLEEQIAKLSPADFCVEQVIRWAQEENG